MSIGTDTYIDRILREYIPREARSESIIGELFEDETNALLYALLVEQRRGGEGAVAPHNVAVVANEKWNDGNPEQVSFDGDLNAGDTEVAARLTTPDSQAPFHIVSVGVTSHKADIDGDSKDENVERYFYEYRDTPGGTWNTLNGPSGVLPLGDLAVPAELVTGSPVGPVYGFRVRIYNRTDKSQYTATTVPEDEIGARVHAYQTGVV